MFCLSCDKKISKLSKFCKYCGKPQQKTKFNFLKIFISTGSLLLISIFIVLGVLIFNQSSNNGQQKINWEFAIPTSSFSPTPTIVKIKSTNTDDGQPWGVAKQIDEHTWNIKVGEDPTMATANEILIALNDYRNNHGSQKLTMDSNLTVYAQTRADFFNLKKDLDGHQGFNNFLNNQDGFNKLGFNWLGENASYGYQLNGVHLIEWVYGGDKPHDENQLDTKWDHVGIGIKNTSTCIIFGTGKM